MPLETIRIKAAEAIATALETGFGHRPDRVDLEVPPRRELGDLAWPGALPLAKVLRRAPRQIAESVVAGAAWPDWVERAEVAGPGFVNLFLRRGPLLAALLRARRGSLPPHPVESVIVEHTNINPNKAAHIGHLRNAVLGDVLVRCLRHLSHRVEVQNYIDDTGVQVADVVVGILYLPETDVAASLGVEVARRDDLLEEVVARLPGSVVPPASVQDFDDFCWDLYPRVTARYEGDPDLARRRGEVLHAVEAGAEGLDLEAAIHLLRGAVIAGEEFPPRAVARLAAEVAEGNLRCHLATMARLGVPYDLLPHESDILRLGFWQRAFELLQEAGAIRRETGGKNVGCWVMSLEASPEFADMDDPDKILVRSNGTVTYTGKDIAYQLWKLGLLTDPSGRRHDFGYDRFATWGRAGPAAAVRYGQGERVLARTTSRASQRLPGRDYGAGERVINVIDVRQSYPQKVVREAVRVLGHGDAADRSIHFAYEMVALTPAAIRVLEERTQTSFGLSPEEMAKPFVEMSGRRGIGVKADELLDALEDAAERAIAARLEGAGAPTDVADRARAIAVGALRYLMARQSRNRVLAFDFDEALAFEGDTGPYLQYSAVRAARIFTRLKEERGEGETAPTEHAALEGAELPDDLWELVLACARRREIVAQATASLELSLLTQHVHDLAQLFHKLYRGHRIIQEADDRLRALRRAVFTVFAHEVRTVLEELLGIPIPEEM